MCLNALPRPSPPVSAPEHSYKAAAHCWVTITKEKAEKSVCSYSTRDKWPQSSCPGRVMKDEENPEDSIVATWQLKPDLCSSSLRLEWSSNPKAASFSKLLGCFLIVTGNVIRTQKSEDTTLTHRKKNKGQEKNDSHPGIPYTVKISYKSEARYKFLFCKNIEDSLIVDLYFRNIRLLRLKRMFSIETWTTSKEKLTQIRF